MEGRNIVIGLAAILQTAMAPGQQARPPHRLGDHPAVVVKRLEARRGYDYASKFYPHPAWLYLRAQPPEEVAATATACRDKSPTGPGGQAVAPDCTSSAPDAE